MKVIFKKAGKYRSGANVVEASEADVESKKVFIVDDTNALEFIDVNKAVRADKPKPVDPPKEKFGEEAKPKPKNKVTRPATPKE